MLVHGVFGVKLWGKMTVITDSIFFDGRSKSLAIVLPLVQECKRSAGRCSISFIRQVGKLRTSYFKHIG